MPKSIPAKAETLRSARSGHPANEKAVANTVVGFGPEVDLMLHTVRQRLCDSIVSLSGTVGRDVLFQGSVVVLPIAGSNESIQSGGDREVAAPGSSPMQVLQSLFRRIDSVFC